jgi:hypothetical protein
MFCLVHCFSRSRASAFPHIQERYRDSDNAPLYYALKNAQPKISPRHLASFVVHKALDISQKSVLLLPKYGELQALYLIPLILAPLVNRSAPLGKAVHLGIQ